MRLRRRIRPRYGNSTPGSPPCQDSVMANLGEHEQMTLVNSLILDTGVLQGRVEVVLERLRATDGQSAETRARAVSEFFETLQGAMTKLRQEGLHPKSQGTLW